MSLVVSFDKELPELLKVKEKASISELTSLHEQRRSQIRNETINITTFGPPRPSSHLFMASLTRLKYLML